MVALAAPRRRQTVPVDYWPIGGARELWSAKDREVLIEGPAGTGKTVACLQRLHKAAAKYAGMRGLMVRKTQKSLKESALVTYQSKVLHPLDGVTYYGGSDAEPAAFRYPNGSRILIGGMDNTDKTKSTEFDMIYVNEGTELTEDDLEMLTRSLRNGVMPYQQIVVDCNPDIPTHWLNLRCDAGKTRRILSRHKDNPRYYDPRREAWTREGMAYLDTLRALSGVRRIRLLDGLWVAAEGQVYADWDPAIHLIDRFEIPAEWARFRVIDFGYRNPFVCQWWAEGPDGDLYRYRELYRTGMLVSDAAQKINRYSAGETYQGKAICDHDAEDRATLEDNGIPTIGANKAVKTGIEAVQTRMRPDSRGKPRMYFLRDSLVEPDESLREARKPTCTEEEIPGYVWDDKATKEAPVKINDHGSDATRYLVMHIDGPQGPGWSAVAPDVAIWLRSGGIA